MLTAVTGRPAKLIRRLPNKLIRIRADYVSLRRSSYEFARALSQSIDTNRKSHGLDACNTG